MLSIGELATAAQYGLPLIVCVFNDRGYGMLRFIQDMAVGGRRTGVELATPNFEAVGAAFGIKSATIGSA
jgi:acetolactate synthase-1/2/3 large subunit